MIRSNKPGKVPEQYDDALLSLTRNAFDGLERMVELQSSTLRMFLAQSREYFRLMTDAQNSADVLTAHITATRPAIDHLTTQANEWVDLFGELQKTSARIAESQINKLPATGAKAAKG